MQDQDRATDRQDGGKGEGVPSTAPDPASQELLREDLAVVILVAVPVVVPLLDLIPDRLVGRDDLDVRVDDPNPMRTAPALTRNRSECCGSGFTISLLYGCPVSL